MVFSIQQGEFESDSQNMLYAMWKWPAREGTLSTKRCVSNDKYIVFFKNDTRITSLKIFRIAYTWNCSSMPGKTNVYIS